MHIPVLLNEVLELLDLKPGENFIDCTLGQGGHTFAILEKTAPDGKVLGIEWDEEEFLIFNSKFLNQRLVVANGNYADLKKIVEENNFTDIAGILLDLGFSSWQTDESKKGFSFLRDEELDMRYGAGELTAKVIVNTWDQERIEEIFERYGEEKFAGKIAQKICEERRQKEISTTFELVEIIKKAVPVKYLHAKIHPATRAFQALRIAVNHELENLEKTLPQAMQILRPGGRIAVISFHSLEDRIVKNFFKEQEQKGFAKIKTKKPVEAQQGEVNLNPRARSAKLRVSVKI